MRSRRSCAKRAGRGSGTANLSAAARMEALEGRLLFSTSPVTTLGDSAGVVTPAGTNKFNATTLRAAVTGANTHSGADTINFAAGLVGTIGLGKALPRINDTLTVAGPGASKLTVQRNSGATTAFAILHLNAGKTATVSGLAIAKGTGDLLANGQRDGGGVFNQGTLTLVSDTLAGNSGNSGGGIYDLGTLFLRKSSVSGSTAAFYSGGGILTAGTMAVSNSTISNNHAAYYGAGIHNAGTLTLANTPISRNNAGIGGGGGWNQAGIFTCDNSTLSGNTATVEYGGGIYNSTGKIVLTNCTVSGNISTQFSGGGIFNASSAVITACTISGNAANRFSGGGIY